MRSKQGALEANGLGSYVAVAAAIGMESLDFLPPPKGLTGLQTVRVAGNAWSIPALSRNVKHRLGRAQVQPVGAPNVIRHPGHLRGIMPGRCSPTCCSSWRLSAAPSPVAPSWRLENLLLRQQLAVLTRPTRKRPRLRRRDKLFWVLARRLWRPWRQHLVIVRPETVLRWHRQGWKLFWRWSPARGSGRPRLSAEVRELIATMARDNPRWGSERIRGELLKLGIAVSKRSIQRYRRRGPAGPPSQTWRTFLRQPRRRDLGGRPVHRPDADVPDALRARRHRARPPRAGARERHRAPDRRLGVAPAGRGHRVGAPAALPAPRSGRRLRRRLRRAGRGAGDRVAPHARAGAARERHRGAGHRHPPAGVPRPPGPLDERHLRSVLTEYVAYYNAERPHARTSSRRCPGPRPRAGPSGAGRYWAVCTTSTSASPDPARTFAPLQGDQLHELLLGDTVVERAPEVRPQLVGTGGGDERRDGDEAPIAFRELGALPEVAVDDLFSQVDEPGRDVADPLAKRAIRPAVPSRFLCREPCKPVRWAGPLPAPAGLAMCTARYSGVRAGGCRRHRTRCASADGGA